MAHCRPVLPVENRVRHRGMTRRAMNVIEAGHYVPSTLAAMRLAKALSCQVADLFQLIDAPRQMKAEWLGEPSTVDVKRPRIQLACMGSRLLARPLTGAGVFTAADGLTIAAPRAGHPDTRVKPWVTVDLWIDPELPGRTLVVLGCDPAMALLGAHVTRRYLAYRLIWVESSSLAALRLLGCGEAHAAGTYLWDPDTGEDNMPYVRRELFCRNFRMRPCEV